MDARLTVDSFLGAGLILTCLHLINLFAKSIFVLNFSTAGVNSSIYASLLLLGCVIFVIVPVPVTSLSMKVTWCIFGLFSLLVLIPNSLIAIYASGIGIISLIRLLVNFVQQYSFALAISFYIAIFVFFDGINIFASLFGKALYVCCILALVVSGLLRQNLRAPTDRCLRIYPLIFLSVLFLAVPHVISTWTYPGFNDWLGFLPHTTYTYLLRILALVGIFSGILLAESRFFKELHSAGKGLNDKDTIESKQPAEVGYKLRDIYLYILCAVFLITVFDLVFLYILPLLTLPISLFTTVLLSLNGKKVEANRYFWLKFFSLQFFTLISLYFHLLAGNWAFAPAYLRGIVRGLAGFYIYVYAIFFIVIQLIWRYKNE